MSIMKVKIQMISIHPDIYLRISLLVKNGCELFRNLNLFFLIGT